MNRDEALRQIKLLQPGDYLMLGTTDKYQATNSAYDIVWDFASFSPCQRCEGKGGYYSTDPQDDEDCDECGGTGCIKESQLSFGIDELTYLRQHLPDDAFSIKALNEVASNV